MPRTSSMAASALILAAGPALAQQSTSSVTLSGIVDLSAQYMQTKGGNQSTSKTTLESGNFAASRLVFSVREDLGGGLVAGAFLDHRFSADSGAASSVFYAGNSYVFVGGGFGRVTLGRQTPISIDKLAYNDPGLANLYGIYNTQAIALANVRVNNSIKYESPSFGGFTAQALYGFGQEVADKKAGRYIGLGASYAIDKWSVHAYTEQTNGTNTDVITLSGLTDKRYSLSARYKGNPLDIYVGATRVNGDLQLSPRGTIWWASASYAVTPVVTAYVFGTQYRVSSGNANLVSIGGRYLLSKRTWLYALAGQRANAPTTSYGLQYPITAGIADAKQTGVAVGIAHLF